MTSERQSHVFIVLPGRTDFVVAGRFRVAASPDGVPLGEFVYGRSYLDRPDAVELDPVELRLAERLYQTTRMDGFFGAIRDSMPDHWGRLLIERRFGVAQLDEFDYLAEGPDDRAGALGFGAELEPPSPRLGFSPVLDLADLQAAADAVLAGQRGRRLSIAGRARELLLEGTSMGGARPKAVVEDDRALWLAKLGRDEDRWNAPLVEHAFLQLADKCGLDVAASRVERIGDRHALLVRRFDREWRGQGYARSRMVSALTLLRADDRVTDRRRWSYLQLADEVRRVSARPRRDLHELFGRMCLNAAISNLDDHPRNHAVVAHGREWRLSPAYDLAPVAAMSVVRRDLAMTCGPQGRWANRANLLGGAGRFLLDRAAAAAIFDRVAATVRSSWQATMREHGVSERDCDVIRHAVLYNGLFYEM